MCEFDVEDLERALEEKGLAVFSVEDLKAIIFQAERLRYSERYSSFDRQEETAKLVDLIFETFHSEARDFNAC